MIYDRAATNGLVSSIHQVRRVAWLLRDRISVDAWLILNQLDQQFSTPALHPTNFASAPRRIV